MRAHAPGAFLALLLISVFLAPLPARSELIGNDPTKGLCSEQLQKCYANPACGLVLACYAPCKRLPPLSGQTLQCASACHNRGLKLVTYAAYDACLKL